MENLRGGDIARNAGGDLVVFLVQRLGAISRGPNEIRMLVVEPFTSKNGVLLVKLKSEGVGNLNLFIGAWGVVARAGFSDIDNVHIDTNNVGGSFVGSFAEEFENRFVPLGQSAGFNLRGFKVALFVVENVEEIHAVTVHRLVPYLKVPSGVDDEGLLVDSELVRENDHPRAGLMSKQV